MERRSFNAIRRHRLDESLSCGLLYKILYGKHWNRIDVSKIYLDSSGNVQMKREANHGT